MSRLDELKKQYPELNVSMFDLMVKLDPSKTYKYLPLICKLFSRRFNPETVYLKDERSKLILELHSGLINKGISTNNLTDKELMCYNTLLENYNSELFSTLKDFIHYMDHNQIENKDVTSYKSIEDMRGAITLASIKEFTKEMENQVIREYEDETWIAVRPLTFTASAKYGAGTRWCTTYQREKVYFERYWRGGILCYFINKKTGYKFAGYRSLPDREMSFWNSSDVRVDYLDLEIDDYMFTNIRKIFSSEYTNKNLSSDEIQEQVHKECIDQYGKVESIGVLMEQQQPVEEDIMEEPNETLRNAAQRYNELRNVSMTAVPRYVDNVEAPVVEMRG